MIRDLDYRGIYNIFVYEKSTQNRKPFSYLILVLSILYYNLEKDSYDSFTFNRITLDLC